MNERGLPKWRVVLEDKSTVDHEGFLEYLKFGAIAFSDRSNEILKLYAHGTWREVTRIYQ
jgi:hypothetical protein